MLRGNAALRITLRTVQRLREEAAKAAGETRQPAARLRAEQTVQQIDRILPTLVGALVQSELRREVEEVYDLPCSVEVFDVALAEDPA